MTANGGERIARLPATDPVDVLIEVARGDWPDLSWRFIRSAPRTESLVEQTRHIACGPPRVPAKRRVGEHATAGVLMRPHMPTSPLHMDRAIEKAVACWYARTRERLDERFDPRLAAGGE